MNFLKLLIFLWILIVTLGGSAWYIFHFKDIGNQTLYEMKGSIASIGIFGIMMFMALYIAKEWLWPSKNRSRKMDGVRDISDNPEMKLQRDWNNEKKKHKE